MEATRRCWKCKSMVAMPEMKFDITGHDLICQACLVKENRGDKRDIEQNTDTETTISESIPIIDEKEIKNSSNNNDEAKVSYQCGSCGFGFSGEWGAVTERCPYCGKENVRTAFRNSTQKLMEETEKEKFDD